ncbi:MAG TPA: GNAT family N-acetyltransferase [Actinoplanes sp.]|nr:GNAT family N-acetyltransferase [Actinoplanes sp.]
MLVLDGCEPIAHASVVQRRFLHAGRSWRGGYAEAVAVHPGRRGQGHAATVMTRADTETAGRHVRIGPAAGRNF